MITILSFCCLSLGCYSYLRSKNFGVGPTVTRCPGLPGTVPVSRNNLSSHIMRSPFRYSVFRLIRPDQSEREERSPLVQTYPMNRTKLSPLKNNPLEHNCFCPKDNIDNRRGQPLTNLAGSWMNRVESGNSVKRGVWSTDANEQRKLQRNRSYDYNIKYYIIHVYIFILCIRSI